MSFKLLAQNGFIKISAPELRPYDNTMNRPDDYYDDFLLEIQAEGMNLQSRYYGSIAQLVQLKENLKISHSTLKGNFQFINYPESNLELQFTMVENGHLHLDGKFWEIGEKRLMLDFRLNSDQSYLPEAISRLSRLIDEVRRQTV